MAHKLSHDKFVLVPSLHQYCWYNSNCLVNSCDWNNDIRFLSLEVVRTFLRVLHFFHLFCSKSLSWFVKNSLNFTLSQMARMCTTATRDGCPKNNQGILLLLPNELDVLDSLKMCPQLGSRKRSIHQTLFHLLSERFFRPSQRWARDQPRFHYDLSFLQISWMIWLFFQGYLVVHHLIVHNL